MTGPNATNNSENMGMLNSSGVGPGNYVGQGNFAANLIDAATSLSLDPLKPPPTMKTFVYSPDVRVVILSGGREYDVSQNVVRGQLFRRENSASTFVCELTNKNNQYTENGGLFDRMDRIAVYMKRINWVQVFSGYLDTVPFAQMWAGNINIKATCTLKRLLYTYWNPNLAQSAVVFNQMAMVGAAVNGVSDIQGASTDTGLGDLLGNLVCWVGGWSPSNVHIQDFPLNFYSSMEAEFRRIQIQNGASTEAFKTLLEGYDHSTGVMSAADQKYLSTGPGLGPQGLGAPFYQQQVIKAVDDKGLGPKTKDIQSSYAVEQSGMTAQGSRDDASRTAGEETVAMGQNLQTQARTADAAILAFACVMAESSWAMRANAAIPESLGYPHELMSTDHNSIGLFQQRNQGWGTVAQRMNAYTSAIMFLDALEKFDWRNMEPAEAIARVQRNRDGAATYMVHIATATQEVAAIRAGQGKFNPDPAFGGIGVSSIQQAVAGQSIVSTAVGAVGNAAISQNNPSPGSIPVGNTGRPQPDAQGAVECALAMCVGKPYVRGGSNPATGFDAAGLVSYCYRSIGRDIGPGTAQQSQNARNKIATLAEAQPGDVIQFNGGQHTAILISAVPPVIVEAPPDGTGITRMTPLVYPDVSGIYRYADYGGPGPAPFNPVAGPGLPVGVGSTAGITGGTGSDGQSEPIARNLFSYTFNPATYAPSIANLFSGEKSFIDCQPLIQEVQAVCRSGLRNFASAPNGDFMAYYPDYFGVDNKHIAMTIEDIEMKDVRINLSDDAMTTHVYVSGDMTMVGQKTEALGWLATMGVATVENETLFQRLRRVVPGHTDGLSGGAILQKYGVRPLQMDFNMIASHKLEFLVACQLFMQKWAEQYETAASFTFMPELFPGMRVGLANTGIAVYVSEVTHTFDWEQGFSTSAKIMAPSSANGADAVNNVMYNMPADATKVATPTTVPNS